MIFSTKPLSAHVPAVKSYWKHSVRASEISSLPAAKNTWQRWPRYFAKLKSMPCALPGAIGRFGNHRRLPAGYRVAASVFGLAPDNLCFEPEMTCYHVTITVASRPENRTSGTRRAEPPVFGVGMGKSIMGAVICCKSNIRAEGTPKPSPWNPAYGRLHRRARAAALTNPAQPCAGWIPPSVPTLERV
jgi:hypothetical protein